MSVVCAILVSSVAVVPNDPDFVQQWALKNTGQTFDGQPGTPGADIGAAEAWEVHAGAANVVVAIIGSGVNPHPEFADRLLEGHAAPLAGGDPYSTLDEADHGTRLAGIIGAKRDDGTGVAGLNDRAWLLPVRVVNGAVGAEAAAAQGIVWAVDHGADIIVVSVRYFTDTPALRDAVSYAALHDVLVVAPVGHEGSEGVGFPAAYDECLAVAATDHLDTPASFANHGLQVGLSAPSVYIWSTTSSGTYGYEEHDSSAWAAAYVGGVASLIRSYAPQLTATQVRQILLDSTDDLGDPGWDPYFGVGRLNAGLALQMTPPPVLRFEHDSLLPTAVVPESSTEFRIRIVDGTQQALPASARLFYRVPPGGFSAVALQHLGNGEYRVLLPAVACETTIEYFLRATGNAGTSVTDPLDAPQQLHQAQAIRRVELLTEDFESEGGWTTTSEGGESTKGQWGRVIPVGTIAQPGFDYSPDGGAHCFVTAQHFGGEPGINDVDGGPVALFSPTIHVSTADAEVSYARWFHTNGEELDQLVVELSLDDGATWATVEIVSATQHWTTHSFLISDFPQLSGSSLRLRFTTADLARDSLTEAAIDDVLVRGISCSAIRGDADGDDDIDAADYARSVGCWRGPGVPPAGPTCAAFDLSGDIDADLADFAFLQNDFGIGTP